MIGAYLVGKEVSWKVLYLVHVKCTIRKYENILSISFREELPEEGRYTRKSVAFQAVQEISNFWKVVKGEIPGNRSPQIC